MKKIYLLSAAACMLAISAKASIVIPGDNSGWGTLLADAETTIAAELIPYQEGASASMVKLVVTGGDPGGQWKCQFVTPMWVAPGDEGNSFLLRFDMKYEGSADAGSFRIASGKTDPGYDGAFQGTNLYDPEGPTGNTQIVDEDGNPVVYDPDRAVAKDWTEIKYDYFLGAQGADSVHLEFDMGAIAGTYYIKNIEVIVDDEVIESYFMDPSYAGYGEEGGEGQGGTAISAAAAVKAFFANDVLYASEAADVVVYNVNGVAVKSAKNAKSVNVADLKAGLYIAKVGNATVKFVK
jgi:hypothetical protein